MTARPIFVFGSNLGGVHGKGAALCAKEKHGAESGVGVGRTGNAYAIPTKGHPVYPERGSPYLPVLTLAQIASYADEFCQYAMENPELRFQLTAVGCGLAGYKPHQVAPLFLAAPGNVLMPPEWRAALSGLPASRFWSYKGEFAA